MRRALALLILIAIPIGACGTGTTVSQSPAAGDSAAMSSGDASITAGMTEPMMSGSGAAGTAARSSGSMTDHPESPMMTEDSMHPTDAMTPESPPAATAGVTITTAGSYFGPVLFDGTGQAIYLFDRETRATPDCYGDCAAAWPPVLTDGAPVADADAVAGLLGTTARSDGSTQVTYAGHPLYFYAHEGKNVVTCHNVDEFGGRWLVVTPTGQAAS